MTALPHHRPSPKRDTSEEDSGKLLLGEDWEAPETAVEPSLHDGRRRRGLFSLNHSPLARKIIVFNLIGLVVLVAGVLFMNPARDSLVDQREAGLVNEARLIADVIAASPGDPARSLSQATIAPGSSAYLYSPEGVLLARAIGVPRDGEGLRSTVITDFLNTVWEGINRLLSGGAPARPGLSGEALAKVSAQGPEGGTQFAVVTPIRRSGLVTGIVGVTSAEGEIDHLVRDEREQILQMFVVALLVSIGLSLVLASTIANPLSDLAAAAEIGRDRDSRTMAPGRVCIPDLSARPDEIGRLSIAMRGMVAALYDRIDANEQFAADVSHEIKNPLASLRSAVGSLRMVRKEEHKEKLLDVIEHDVRRLDRLVSDISNASRLDSELVKEEEESFNLTRTLGNLTEYLGEQAREKGVEFITDFPPEPIRITGLEARLAQVFVNLITNAISFCEDGDAVRVWARKRDNRVLVVVEDTGPGIPEQALTNIFKRFYSERPKSDFGNHSGLGLAISKQIVEAHGGVIWAENIRPTQADITSEPLGARFVVGLPV
jgi:two-component system sensor histidine kinase ChvG